MIVKTIRSLYYILFFLTPLFMFSFTSELFEFNKMMLIYLVGILIAGLWLLKSVQEKKFFVRRTILDIPIALFLGSQILSTFFSIDPHTSLFGYYGRFNGGLIGLFSYLILFYAAATFLQKKDWITLFRWSLFSSVLVILWGLPGRFGHDLSCLLYSGQFNNSCWTDQFRPAERMFSTLGQPNWLGAYLSINFFIGLYFFSQGNVVRSAIYAAYLILNFSAILFTRSRSALIATVVGTIIFFGFFYVIRDGRKVLQKRLKAIGVLFAALLVAVVIFKTGIDKIDRFLTLPNNPHRTESVTGGASGQAKKEVLSSEITESLDIRKIVWKGAIELGLKYPLLGTGVETFAYSYYSVRPREHNLTSEWDFLYNKAHNEYLNYFATTGFLGTLTYLALVGVTLFLFISKLKEKLFRSQGMSEQEKNSTIQEYWEDKVFILGLFCGYITILITNFFGFSTTTINMFFYIIPAVAAAKEAVFERNLSRTGVWVVGGIGLIGIVYLLIGFARYYVADVQYALGINYNKINDYQQSAIHFGNAVGLHYEPVYLDKYSYALANLAFIAAYQKQHEVEKKLISTAEYYNDASLRASPGNVIYWKTKGKNDYLFYQINLDTKYLEDGIKALKTAQTLAPTDPKIPYSLAIYYSLLSSDTKDMNKKALNTTLSLNEIDDAIELKADYRDAYVLKAQLLKSYGQTKEARRVLEYILQKLVPGDQEASKELQNL